jgi:hypothetical protein
MKNSLFRVLNKTTGRFYVGFSSKFNRPLWSAPHRPLQGLKLFEAQAAAVVRQLTALEPSLDLQLVEAA